MRNRWVWSCLFTYLANPFAQKNKLSFYFFFIKVGSVSPWSFCGFYYDPSVKPLCLPWDLNQQPFHYGHSRLARWASHCHPRGCTSGLFHRSHHASMSLWIMKKIHSSFFHSYLSSTSSCCIKMVGARTPCQKSQGVSQGEFWMEFKPNVGHGVQVAPNLARC